MKKRILCFIAAIAALWCILGIPAPEVALAAPSYMYFESYDVDVVVQENNVLNVTETIVADYDQVDGLRHGILREIPVELDFSFPDGTSKRFRIILSDVDVIGQPYSVSKDGAYQVLRIGDADEYATGLVTYIIQYKYDMGDDFYEAADFLYYNVIGTEWYADIHNASFSVQMPKPFDQNDVVAYAGGYGTKSTIDVAINGNTISGSVQDLGTYEGITLIVDLPEGYYVGERTGPPFVPILLVVFALIVAAAFVLFLLFGRDSKVVQTVEFNAPDGMTPAEVGYIIDGSVDNKDISSLIIYWADKGYLSLTELDKKDIRITKLRELSENARAFEKTMFEALFKKGESVNVSSLKNTFYTTMETTKTKVANSFKARPIFTKTSMTMQGFVGFLTALPVVLAFFFTILYDIGELMSAGIFSVLALGLVLGPVYALIKLVKSWRGLERRKRFFRLVLSLVILGVAFIGFIGFMALFADSLLLGIASVVATMMTAICAMFIRKRSKLGTDLMGKVLGLKNFIEKAEKDRIIMLVQENPNYFYSVLPYAYVLGVTDRWAKNFDRIGIQPDPPGWYTGYGRNDMFTTIMFMNMFNNSMHSINSSFVSRPAPQGGSSGGSFGGGGFGGGGFGGGGGGGW